MRNKSEEISPILYRRPSLIGSNGIPQKSSQKINFNIANKFFSSQRRRHHRRVCYKRGMINHRWGCRR